MQYTKPPTFTVRGCLSLVCTYTYATALNSVPLRNEP
jgi:hypothetical protein